MSDSRNPKIRVQDNSPHAEAKSESDDANPHPKKKHATCHHSDESDTTAHPATTPDLLDTTTSLKAEFDALKKDIAIEVIKHLGPDDRVNLGLITKEYYRFFDDNSVWRARFIRHFPHLTYLHDLTANLDFKKLFIDTERTQYAELNKEAIHRLRKIKDGVMKDEFLALDEPQLAIKDRSGISMIEWASIKRIQPLLDEYHQRTLAGIIISRSPQSKKMAALTKLQSLIFCRQGYKALNEFFESVPLTIYEEIKNNRNDLLQLAAQLGDADSVKELLRFNTDPNIEDANGYTALHFASKYGHVKIVAQLLAAGAHPNPVKANDLHPLVTALLYGHLDCAMLIKKAGGNPNGKHERQVDDNTNQEDGIIAMQIDDRDEPIEQHILTTAVATGREDLTAALIALGANVNCVSEQYNDPPLYYAVLEGRTQSVNLLVKAGARTDIQTKTTKSNFTSYMSLAEPSVIARIADFLAQFPEETITVTPLQIAQGLGYDEIAHIIRSRNGDDEQPQCRMELDS